VEKNETADMVYGYVCRNATKTHIHILYVYTLYHGSPNFFIQGPQKKSSSLGLCSIQQGRPNYFWSRSTNKNVFHLRGSTSIENFFIIE